MIFLGQITIVNELYFDIEIEEVFKRVKTDVMRVEITGLSIHPEKGENLEQKNQTYQA